MKDDCQICGTYHDTRDHYELAKGLNQQCRGNVSGIKHVKKGGDAQ